MSLAHMIDRTLARMIDETLPNGGKLFRFQPTKTLEFAVNRAHLRGLPVRAGPASV